jgi:hypothetical protein
MNTNSRTVEDIKEEEEEEEEGGTKRNRKLKYPTKLNQRKNHTNNVQTGGFLVITERKYSLVEGESQHLDRGGIH